MFDSLGRHLLMPSNGRGTVPWMTMLSRLPAILNLSTDRRRTCPGSVGTRTYRAAMGHRSCHRGPLAGRRRDDLLLTLTNHLRYVRLIVVYAHEMG